MADNVVVEFSPTALDSLSRMILHGDKVRVEDIKTMTRQTLARLGVKPELSKAVSKLPAGSDQIDLGSFRVWLDKLNKTDTMAIAQLVLLDATAHARF